MTHTWLTSSRYRADRRRVIWRLNDGLFWAREEAGRRLARREYIEREETAAKAFLAMCVDGQVMQRTAWDEDREKA